MKKTKPADHILESEGTRLNKYIAHAGVCSRRKAAELVKDGQIKVNGEIETNPAILVLPKDAVEYQGKKLHSVKKRIYILMNKPKNTVTTTSDERGRATVMDILRRRGIQDRVYPVGRLDRATTGLLLFTNDGDLAKKLSHPSHEVKKIYHVILDKPLKNNHLEKIKNGLTLEDGHAPVDKINYVDDRPKTEIGIEIHIGRNRIVRRIFAHLGYTVIKLDRVYYAGLTKKDLPRGWIRPLKKKEIIMLRHFT